MKLEVEAIVDFNDIAGILGEDDAHRAIMAIDLAQADTEFTVEAVKRLVHSLSIDYGQNSIRKMLKELRKEFK
jgi:hypothetical protein